MSIYGGQPEGHTRTASNRRQRMGNAAPQAPSAERAAALAAELPRNVVAAAAALDDAAGEPHSVP